MNHLILFENFSLNEYEDLRGTKALKTKGLTFSHGSDFGDDHYVQVEYKKPLFGKAVLPNGEHKFMFVSKGRTGQGRHGSWIDEKGNEVTDSDLIDDLIFFINLQGDDELATLTSQ